MPSFGRVPVFSEEWGEQFSTTMQDYLTRLEQSLEDAIDADVETISGEPFCGCSVCWERETYLMAVKLAIEGHEAGLVWLEDPVA